MSVVLKTGTVIALVGLFVVSNDIKPLAAVGTKEQVGVFVGCSLLGFPFATFQQLLYQVIVGFFVLPATMHPV